MWLFQKDNFMIMNFNAVGVVIVVLQSVLVLSITVFVSPATKVAEGET